MPLKLLHKPEISNMGTTNMCVQVRHKADMLECMLRAKA